MVEMLEEVARFVGPSPSPQARGCSSRAQGLRGGAAQQVSTQRLDDSGASRRGPCLTDAGYE